MSSKGYKSLSVGQIVASDFNTATVFARLGIDFCCHGNVMFTEACRLKGLDPQKVEHQLDEICLTTVTGIPSFSEWPLDLLIDYVLKIHHRNIRTRGPQITALLNKVVNRHDEYHPELTEVSQLFRQALIDLENHLSKEEQVLFPYVYEMCEANYNDLCIEPFGCGTIQHPISVMEDEHSHEGELFERISELTGNFAAPDDACVSYRLVLEQLKQFRDALHEHIHLENNIIFPRAMAMEQTVAKGLCSIDTGHESKINLQPD